MRPLLLALLIIAVSSALFAGDHGAGCACCPMEQGQAEKTPGKGSGIKALFDLAGQAGNIPENMRPCPKCKQLVPKDLPKKQCPMCGENLPPVVPEKPRRINEEKPPVSNTCCKLLMVQGLSEAKNANGQWATTNKPIQTAHDAGINYYLSRRHASNPSSSGCIHFAHRDWRGTEKYWGLVSKSGKKITTKGEEPVIARDWEVSSTAGSSGNWIKEHIRGNEGKCIRKALVIYHGEKKRSTSDALKWLMKSTRVPIYETILWSCWGSEQIKPDDKIVQAYWKEMNRRAEKNAVHCQCRLVMITGSDLVLDNNMVQPLDAWIEEVKNQDLGDKHANSFYHQLLKSRKILLERLASGQTATSYSTPLGINPDAGSLRLQAYHQNLKFYDMKTGATWIEQVQNVFDDIPVEDNPVLGVKGLVHYIESDM